MFRLMVVLMSVVKIYIPRAVKSCHLSLMQMETSFGWVNNTEIIYD